MRNQGCAAVATRPSVSQAPIRLVSLFSSPSPEVRSYRLPSHKLPTSWPAHRPVPATATSPSTLPSPIGRAAMSNGSLSKVVVIGCGISGAVCASILAAAGVSVTIFETGRGAGGRMSQRRETMEDGRELYLDHGAPYFSVSDKEVMSVVSSWETRGLVAEWPVLFGSFDQSAGKFVDLKKDGSRSIKKYVGVPGMNSICKSLCSGHGVEAKYGITVGKVDWLHDRNLWSLIGMDGQDLGHFDGLVASDKNVVSTRFAGVTGRPPPLDIASSPDLAILSQDIPVHSCFALMLAFSEPLSWIPVKGFSFENSEILRWAYCDSSKPGRSHASPSCECWVLHSTAEYAHCVIARTSLKKLSTEALNKVAEELLDEFQATGLNIPRPFFMKAHRWGSAFPDIAIGGDEKCLCDKNKRLAICGDFCASPNVEGAVLSAIRAASKILGNSSNL